MIVMQRNRGKHSDVKGALSGSIWSENLVDEQCRQYLQF